MFRISKFLFCFCHPLTLKILQVAPKCAASTVFEACSNVLQGDRLWETHASLGRWPFHYLESLGNIIMPRYIQSKH